MNKNKDENALVTQSLMYSAPLPTANEFAGYEKALPGAANRILKMAEQEAEHRRENEKKVINESFKVSKRGQTAPLLFLLFLWVLLAYAYISDSR